MNKRRIKSWRPTDNEGLVLQTPIYLTPCKDNWWITVLSGAETDCKWDISWLRIWK